MARTTSSGSAATVVASGQALAPAPTVDVAGAEQSALGLFTKRQLNLSDPSVGYVWTSSPESASHMTPAVNARLIVLKSGGYFSDAGGCGEDYISAGQNGLNTAPIVSSVVADANGSVTVVIQRGPARPDLTAVMTGEGSTWLASDLASGTGPSASIFSAKPNC
jgi:hypothetical protein